MQVSTELKPLFSFSTGYIVILIILLVLLIIGYFFFDWKKKHPKVIIPSNNNRSIIKQKYLEEINNLEQMVRNDEITIRKAYQKLSMLIRLFIYEMTSIKVQNYTLSEIERINLTSLSLLVQEYYNPEFDSMSNGDILSSIEKTREVIIIWN